MTDLDDFLRARLDEDEAAAKGATYERPAWRFDINGVHQQDGLKVAETHSWYISEHIARHDPARILREVEVKRRILRDTFALIESEWGGSFGTSQWGLELLGFLALPYNNHPDYRPEWAPGDETP